MDDRRRLKSAIVALAVTAMTTLAGCAGDNDGEREGSIRVAHKFGETVLDGKPSRIVTLGYNDQDAVLALGQTPVASVSWFDEEAIHPWSEEAADDAGGDAIEIISAAELDASGPEAVAAYKPDLIIAIFTYLTKEEYDQYSKIAPTLVGLEQYPNDGTPWQDQTKLIGQALGLEDEAEDLIASSEKSIADIAKANPEFEGKTAFASAGLSNGQVCLYPSGREGSTYKGGAYGPGYLLPALGFEIPKEFDAMGEAEASPCISYELLSLLDQDLGLWAFPSDDPSAAELAKIPTFQALGLTKEGRNVFTATEVSMALNFSTVLSLPWAAKQLEPQLVAALDGDPTTSTEPS